MLMFALYDSKAEAYLVPFFMKTRGMAIRAVTADLQKNADLSRFAADYTLFELGFFDEMSGDFKQEGHNLGQLSQYMEVR